MSVYVDEIFVLISNDPRARALGAKHGHRWCHLWTDPGSEMELHRVARALTLRGAWFQDKPGFPHYDLVAPRRELAIQQGAIPTDLRRWLEERRQIIRAQMQRMAGIAAGTTTAASSSRSR